MVLTRSKRKLQELESPARRHTDSAGFTHRPLKDPRTRIRLLEILPGDSDDDIRLECHVFDLEDPPAYNAISYTWGSEEGSRIVYVDRKPFEVRNNCHYALWQVRLHFSGELVWIDSICINQRDDNEKSHQVQMMFNIYSFADLVLSCVGPHADNSELLVEATQEVLEMLLEHEQTKYNYHQFDHLQWASSRGEDYFIALRSSLEYFSERPYWSRVWIIQEMRASGPDDDNRQLKILCGHDSLELWALKALDFFWSLKLEEVAERLSWGSIATSAMRKTGLSSAFEILAYIIIPAQMCFQLSRSLSCSDLRDKLYSFLSLLTWPDGFEPIKPDYSKSSWDIFLDMALMLPPSRMLEALQVLGFVVSEADLRVLARQRASAEVLQPLKTFRLSDSVERLGIKSLPKRSIQFISRFPLATLITERNLRPLPRSVTANIGIRMREDIKTTFGVTCKTSDLASYLPFGVYAGEDISILVDHRARPGDFILNADEFLLVLRHKVGSIYDVVGSANWYKEPTKTSEFAWRYERLNEYCGDDCGIFHAKGSLKMSLEDQMAFAGLSQRAVNRAERTHREGHMRYLQFVMQLIKEPEGAVNLDLKPYHIKTDLYKRDVELLCFEGHKRCIYPFCRNRTNE